MRLIDADRLMGDFLCTFYNDLDDQNRTEKLINEAPTVEPKQGEWKHKTDGLPHFVTIEWFICSECGVQKSEATPFCPQCGAVMVKEGEAE